MRLRPSMRENFRYVLARISPDFPFESRDLYRSIAESVTSLYGDGIAAQIWPSVMQVSAPYAIIRCRRGMEHYLETALSAIAQIQGIPAAIHPQKTSGTIRTLQEKIPSCITKRNAKVVISGVRYDAVVSIQGRIDLKEKGIYHEIPRYITEEDTEDLYYDE
ncbi:MAG TPA: Rpp14/Pop5 family protein [Methanospirillum sp.]|nr:Rpp14/Pop5 family protein [Methanospirillum sp.]